MPYPSYESDNVVVGDYIGGDGGAKPATYEPADKILAARGVLARYADPSKWDLEATAFERAMVKKHTRAS